MPPVIMGPLAIYLVVFFFTFEWLADKVCNYCYGIETFGCYYFNIVLLALLWPITIPCIIFTGDLPFVLFSKRRDSTNFNGLPFIPVEYDESELADGDDRPHFIEPVVYKLRPQVSD